MAEEKKPKSLMDYVPSLEKKSSEIRDEETKRELRDLLNQLKTLQLSKGAFYNQTHKLEKDLINDPLSKDEYSDYSFITTLRFFFDSNFNYIMLSEKEVNILSDCILHLLDRITMLNDDLDDLKIKRIDSLQEEVTVKEKPKEEKKEVTSDEDFDSILEEDEEVAVTTNLAFECLQCGDINDYSYLGGCKKCGNNQIKVHYVRK